MITIDHTEYPKRLRRKSIVELEFIRKDANEAIEANPHGEKAGYYMDEIHYASMELQRRRKR